MPGGLGLVAPCLNKDQKMRRNLLQRVFPAGGLLLSLALAAVAQTAVVDLVAKPQTEFGAAAIRAVGGNRFLGRVSIFLSRELKPEGFRIRRIRGGYSIEGGDAAGAMYGALDFAEQMESSAAAPRDKDVQPSLPMRALKFNIPLAGTGYLSQEDLEHNQWFWDLKYWEKFLDMMARNRYNTLTFWSAHPFDHMVRVAKYPEATAAPAQELDRSISFFRKLFQMAADRGVATYLVTWNIHVPAAFAEHHQIPASGFDSPLVRDYQREAIKALLATYPMLTGLGTTVGERMGNMSIPQKLDWIADTYFTALRQSGRPVPFILRAWQSEPGAMAAMLDAVHYPGPVYLDLKFNGEHMYSSTRPHVADGKWMEMAHGRYHLLWHLRNDDLFILRWGDPDFVRETLRSAGGPDSAGFVEGSEIFVPGEDRIHTAAAKAHLDWQYEFEKHWFRYMLWGRVGYAADEPDETWRQQFRRRFGAAGNDTYEAVRQAGKIAPLITSYHWNYMNGDWYVEGSIGSWNTSYEQPRHNYRRAAMYHDIRTYIFNNTIDDGWANMAQFVAGSKIPGPLEAAGRLEEYGRRTLEAIERARPRVERGQKEFACTEADMQAYGKLGLYYAEKLRGAAHLARYLFGAEPGERQQSVAHLERALEAWRGVVAATENHYATHEVWLFGQFDWKRYLPDVANDIRIAQEAKPFVRDSTYALNGMHDWLEYAYQLLGRNVAPRASAAANPVRLDAGDAISITAPMALHEDASAPSGRYLAAAAPQPVRAGNSITGERPTSSAASSALFRFDLPADGEYGIWLDCWWAQAGGRVVVFVDDSATASDGYPLGASSGTPLRTWTRRQLGRTVLLGAGSHTIRIFTWMPDVRIGRVVVALAGVVPALEALR